MVRLFSCCTRNSSRVEEKNDVIETKLIGQTKFIKSYSTNLIKFVYYPLSNAFEDDLYSFNITRECRFIKNDIYKVICSKTGEMIAYFIKISNFYNHNQKWDIYLNNRINIKISKFFTKDIEDLILSFLKQDFTTIPENGTYIGSVFSTKKYEHFKLVLNNSELLKKYEIRSSSYFNSEQKYYSPINIEDVCMQLRYTLLKIDRLKFDSFNKKIETINFIKEIQCERPAWNQELRIHYLNFWGRIKRKSSKNTLFMNKDTNKPWIIFGKIDDDEYILDFTYPLSLIQGIATAISCLNK
tara:strand:- start:620 stop:1513 length:894 start_codon:yes stop_codon:yes gene_type:complete